MDQAVDFVLSKINLAVGTREHGTQAPVEYEMPPEVIREARVAARVFGDSGSALPHSISLEQSRVVGTPGPKRNLRPVEQGDSRPLG